MARGVSRPTPKREVGGSGWGGGLQAYTQGGSRPTLGGSPGPGRCIPACTEADPPADGYCCGQYASYWNAFLFKINSKFCINVSSIQYNIFLSFSFKVYAVTLLVHNFHIPRPHMFTSVYSETCNTKVHQVLQVAANRISDIVFAQCQVHETHQPTVTDLKNEVHRASTM